MPRLAPVMTTFRPRRSIIDPTEPVRRPARSPGATIWSRALLDDERDTLAAADAGRRDADAAAAPLELLEQGVRDARPRRPERVTERDRAAVDVELRGV